MPAAEDLQVTSNWKRMVMEWMRATGIIRAELARRLDVTPGAVTQLFTTAKRSSLVAPINKLMAASPVHAERSRRASAADSKVIERVRSHLLRPELTEIDQAMPADQRQAIEDLDRRTEAEVTRILATMSRAGMEQISGDVLELNSAADQAVYETMHRVHVARMALVNAESDLRRAERRQQEARRAFDRLMRLYPAASLERTAADRAGEALLTDMPLQVIEQYLEEEDEPSETAGQKDPPAAGQKDLAGSQKSGAKTRR